MADKANFELSREIEDMREIADVEERVDIEKRLDIYEIDRIVMDRGIAEILAIADMIKISGIKDIYE